jgi:PAS domain S-box-containing protein
MKFDPQKDFDAVQSILDSLPMGVYLLDRQRRMHWVNKSVPNRLQRQDAFQSGGSYCYKEIFGRKRPCTDCPALKTIKSGRMEYKEIKSRRKGEMRHYLITATPLRKGPAEEALIIETVQDVTDQKQAEEALRQLNDFNAAIINNAPVAIFTIDRSGKFTSVNPALADLSGLGPEVEEKLVGFNWLENPYTVRCGLAEHIKKGLEGQPFELQDFPFTTYRGDRGQYIHFRGVPLRNKEGEVEGLLCIIEDNTEKVKTKIQLIQDAKLSVTGRLMTGIAHELNNPLATIAANSELACEVFQTLHDGRASEDEMNELREYLEVIQEQAFRCKNIIKDMIDLTKKQCFEVNEIDLNACLNDLLKLINFKKMKIRLVKEVPADLPRVRADQNAVKQSLMNVLQNAVDALEEREGGTIRIRAGVNGNAVNVEIEDNGVGIHEGLIDRVFEPYFSTKETGKGVGLGLTLCHEFLSRMGGNIKVESVLGRGSLFRVTLPAYMREKEDL